MSESRPNKAVTDEELIGVLTAISVVSRRLARKLIQLNQTSQSQEGGKRDEQNERNGSDHILPISQGGTHDASNLMSLCQSCHTRIHHELGDR